MKLTKNEGGKRRAHEQIRKEERDSTNPTFVESIKGLFTNISYGISDFRFSSIFSRDSHKEAPEMPAPKAMILGKEVTAKDLPAFHHDIIWFTYKKDIHISSSMHSDIGWGCLIRVAQMALAQALRRYFEATQKKFQKHYIIAPFLEEKGSSIKYGLYRFLEKGDKMWKMRPGQWYSMTQVATILQVLHEESPLKGSQNLRIKVYNEVINLKEIMDVLGFPLCSCGAMKITCIFCLQKTKKDDKQPIFLKSVTKKISLQNSSSHQKHVLLIVTTRMGHYKVGKKEQECLLKLMSLPIFNGCMGGVPAKARFLTGRQLDRISYLDPHYVESAVDQMSLNKKLEVFQCKQIRFMTCDELDPQMGLCFYLTSPSDLQLLKDTIDIFGKDFLRFDWDRDFDFQVLNDPQANRTKLKEHFQDLDESFDYNCDNSSIANSFLMD